MSRLREFISTLKSKGFARPNRYQVILSPPPIVLNHSNDLFRAADLFNNFVAPGFAQFTTNVEREIARNLPSSDTTRLLRLTCETAELPGKQIATTEYNIYGPSYHNPYNQIYDQFNCTFLVTSDMVQKQIFDVWMEKIVSPETNNIQHFYDEFTTSIQIWQLDQENQPIYKVELLKAYPVTVSPLALSYTDTDSVHKLGVTFMYHKWKKLPL